MDLLLLDSSLCTYRNTIHGFLKTQNFVVGFRVGSPPGGGVGLQDAMYIGKSVFVLPTPYPTSSDL